MGKRGAVRLHNKCNVKLRIKKKKKKKKHQLRCYLNEKELIDI